MIIPEEKEYIGLWNNIIEIHKCTKELYLLSEEYSENLKMFIQPIKEMRDALEHIIRAYDKLLSNESLDEKDNDEYIKINLDKALGHEYRAFFDTVDFLSVTFRYKISEVLKDYSYNEIISVYPDYEEWAVRLTEIPEEIADLRKRKDIGNTEDITSIVDKYKKIVIDELLHFYKTIYREILPLLN